MPFPDLDPRPDTRGNTPGHTSTLWAEATGVPDNGDNVFAIPFVGLGMNPNVIDEEWLDIRVEADGPSITGATFVSISGDKLSMTINFVQGGGDAATVTVVITHSLIS